MKTDARTIAEMFATVSLGAPERAIGFVLWRLLHRYQREIDRALAGLDLTHLQFTTLMLVAWLAKDAQPATQSEVARFGDIHPMQVSHMLRVLEGKAMVTRTRSLSNTLAKRVDVTPIGLEALRQALPRAIEVQQRLFGDEGRPGGPLLATLLRMTEGDRA